MSTLIYLRHSPRPKKNPKPGDEPSVDHESIEVQRERCNHYLGYVRPALPEPWIYFEEPLTSAMIPIAERTIGAAMLAELTVDDGPHHIVAQRIDRLFRDAADAITTAREWLERGITVHLADQGGCTINYGSATGRFIFNLFAVQADYARDLTVERTSQSMRSRQRRGQRMSSRTPYGFRVDFEDPARIVEDEYEQTVITRIMALHERRYGLRHICRQLTEDGIACRENGWHHGLIKSIIERNEKDSLLVASTE